MTGRDSRLQAAALRLAAERVERGEPLAPALARALAEQIAQHPEDLAAIEAHEGSLPQWMADELDRRDREDTGTTEDGEAVMARLLSEYGRSPRSIVLTPESGARVAKGLARPAKPTKKLRALMTRGDD